MILVVMTFVDSGHIGSPVQLFSTSIVTEAINETSCDDG